MNDPGLWLASIALLPTLVVIASFLRIDVERLRHLAVGSAAAMLFAAIGLVLSPRMRVFAIRTGVFSWLSSPWCKWSPVRSCRW